MRDATLFKLWQSVAMHLLVTIIYYLGPGQEECAVNMDQRHFQRLPIEIPVFLVGVDKKGKEFLEFTLATDISGGGAVVATRKDLSRGSRLRLEIPTTPVRFPHVALAAKRSFAGRVVSKISKDTYYMYGVRFTRPLIGAYSQKVSVQAPHKAQLSDAPLPFPR